MSPIRTLSRWTHATPAVIAVLCLILGAFAVTSVVLGILTHYRLNEQVIELRHVAASNTRIALDNRKLIRQVEVNNGRIFELRRLQIDALKTATRASCRLSNRSNGILAGLIRTSLVLLEDPTYGTPGLTESQRRAFLTQYRQALHDLRPRDCNKLAAIGAPSSTFPKAPLPPLPAPQASPSATPTPLRPRTQRPMRPARRSPPPSPPSRPVLPPARPPPPPTPSPPVPTSRNPLAPILEPVRSLVCRLLPAICETSRPSIIRP